MRQPPLAGREHRPQQRAFRGLPMCCSEGHARHCHAPLVDLGCTISSWSVRLAATSWCHTSVRLRVANGELGWTCHDIWGPPSPERTSSACEASPRGAFSAWSQTWSASASLITLGPCSAGPLGIVGQRSEAAQPKILLLRRQFMTHTLKFKTSLAAPPSRGSYRRCIGVFASQG